MSFIGQYDLLPQNWKQSQSLQEPMATVGQMREYDKVKRQNNGLIIALVIIIILLVAAVVVVFILLFTSILGTTAATTVTNSLTMGMIVLRNDITYGPSYISSTENGFTNYLEAACIHIKRIGTANSFDTSEWACSATTMSAAASPATGVLIDDFRVAMPLGTTAIDTTLATMTTAIAAGMSTPYSVEESSISKVDSSSVSSVANTVTSPHLPLLLAAMFLVKKML